MITSDKRSNLQKLFVNLTDYSAKCPVGCRTFFAFVRFEDESECMWSNIFAKTRPGAAETFVHCVSFHSIKPMFYADNLNQLYLA